MVLGKLDVHIQKNEIGTTPITLHKNELTINGPKTLLGNLKHGNY